MVFPSRLANSINKLVQHTRLFIGFATLSGNISYIWKSMWINLYLFKYMHCHQFEFLTGREKILLEEIIKLKILSNYIFDSEVF